MSDTDWTVRDDRSTMVRHSLPPRSTMPILPNQLLRALAELARADDPKRALAQTLEITQHLLQARFGYASLGPIEAPMWSEVVGGLDPEAMRARVSRTVRYAVGDGIVTGSAVSDPRFSTSDSVRLHQLKSVVCVPFGRNERRGLMYLEAPEGVRYTDRDLDAARGMAAVASEFVRHLLIRPTASPTDPTAQYRQRLRAGHIVGRSRALAGLLEQLAIVAPRDRSVLLLGPTGSGKSTLARVIHDSSARAAKPFVVVDCTVLRPETAAAELFGHVKGAFTGADRDRLGLVEEADGGTLFLDEVGDLLPEVQRMLLMFLDEGTFRQVGANSVRKINVRVIGATSRPKDCINEALFHRLAKPSIDVPSLESRRDDIALIALSFVECARQSLDIDPLPASEDFLDALMERQWPGNVRELGAAVEDALLRADFEGATELRPCHLESNRADGDGQAPARATLDALIARTELAAVERAIARNNGNRTRAAGELDINRDRLYRILRRDREG